MKKHLLSIAVICLLAFSACNQSGTEEKIESPDYAAFDKNANIVRSFLQAHSDENLNAARELMADSLKYSPPDYNGNVWKNKEDFLAALKSYHENFENIKFAEGIVTSDSVLNGMWSGSVFPKENASSAATNFRVYGTWTAKHTLSGKDIGVKWFALISVNEDGKLIQFSDYFDVNGLAVQIAAN